MHNNLLDVIKYEGDNNVLVAKSVIEDFNTKTQLVVNESQEAIFYKDGQALDLFGAGKHSLNSDNLPLFRRLMGKLFGGKTPFTCEVFFINKVNVLDIMWGTDAPVTLEDPKYHLIIGCRANGQTGIRITDSRKFVIKVVGQLPEFTVDSVRKAIKTLLMAQVKQVIANTIINMGVSILEISTQLMTLSDQISIELNKRLEDIGIEVTHFYVNTINCSDADLAVLKEAREKKLAAMNELDIEAAKTVRMGEAMAKARAVQGYSYQDERKFDVLEGAAKNEGTAGAVLGAGMGLGMGVGVGGAVGGAMGQMMGTMNQQPQPQQQPQATSGSVCPNCGAQLAPGAKFCCECGQKIEPKRNRFCSECGTKLEEGAKFCPNCGHKAE